MYARAQSFPENVMRLLAVLIASVALSALANAQSQGPRPLPKKNESSVFDPKAVQLRPWSDDRMRNATEIKPPVIDLPPSLNLTPPPVPPPPVPPVSGRYADPHDRSAGKLPPSGREASPSSYPLRWAGRLFWSRPGNGQWVDNSCSAQFIAPNMILTAAHCVRNDATGEWGRNFQFALQFDRGRYSHVYQPHCLGTRPDAFQQGSDTMSWRARDYALILTAQPSQTGHFGWQLDWRGAYPEATALGYPLDIQQGNVMQVMSGPLFFPSDLGGMVVMRGAIPGFGPGASGGAWIGNFNTDNWKAGNRVISVSAARNRNQPLLLGPYFDDGFKALYEYVARGCR
jgi:hypothetical protein